MYSFFNIEGCYLLMFFQSDTSYLPPTAVLACCDLVPKLACGNLWKKGDREFFQRQKFWRHKKGDRILFIALNFLVDSIEVLRLRHIYAHQMQWPVT